jgi:hypothetical protein
MNPAPDGSAAAILDALGSGLPMLLLQFLLVLALLVAGIFISAICCATAILLQRRCSGVLS